MLRANLYPKIMATNRKWWALAALALSFAWPGCGKKTALVIEVQPTFHGRVTLLCASSRHGFGGTIGPEGVGAVDCRDLDRKFQIIRNGHVIEPVGQPVWNRTGDGVVNSISFDVP